MAWGAVLGVIFGIMVGLYALPPILKSIYGVDQVALGETWEDGGRTMRVLSVTQVDRAPAGATAVQIEVGVAERWQIDGEDFELELADGERVDLVDVPEGGFVFEPGSPTGTTLTFARLPGQEAEAAYLHLSSPRVRFDLLPDGGE